MHNSIIFIYNNYIIYFLRIIIAVICGFIIGFEREYRRKDADTRTHIITALGASLSMILSAYGFKDNPNVDPTRMAAQVISGIGFLGAGLIFVRSGRTVSGLNTAAGIWATAIISMTIGAGQIVLGIFCTLLLSLVNLYLKKVKIKTLSSKEDILVIEVLDDIFKFNDFSNFLEDLDIEILNIDISNIGNSKLKITATLYLPQKFNKSKLNDLLIHFPGIKQLNIFDK